MISKKTVLLITAMAVVIIAAIAVVPAPRRLVSPVHALPLTNVVILECESVGTGVIYVTNIESTVLLPTTIHYATGCADALQILYGLGFVQQSYSGVGVQPTTPRALFINQMTWTLTAPLTISPGV